MVANESMPGKSALPAKICANASDAMSASLKPRVSAISRETASVRGPVSARVTTSEATSLAACPKRLPTALIVLVA